MMAISSLLRIKSVLSFDNGGVYLKEKICTKKKAIQRLKQILAKKYTEEKPIRMAVLHMHRDAEIFKAWLQEVYPMTNLIGAHVDTGTVAINWCKK